MPRRRERGDAGGDSRADLAGDAARPGLEFGELCLRAIKHRGHQRAAAPAPVFVALSRSRIELGSHRAENATGPGLEFGELGLCALPKLVEQPAAGGDQLGRDAQGLSDLPGKTAGPGQKAGTA